MKKIQSLALAVSIFSLCFSLVVSPTFAQQDTSLRRPPVNDTLGRQGVTQRMLDSINPLKTTGSEQAEQLSTPGGIISRVMEFAFPIAGLILFVMIVWGGFEILYGAADKKSLDAGRQRITAAIIGFVLLFVSYWIIRVIEQVLGIRVIT